MIYCDTFKKIVMSLTLNSDTKNLEPHDLL